MGKELSLHGPQFPSLYNGDDGAEAPCKTLPVLLMGNAIQELGGITSLSTPGEGLLVIQVVKRKLP